MTGSNGGVGRECYEAAAERGVSRGCDSTGSGGKKKDRINGIK